MLFVMYLILYFLIAIVTYCVLDVLSGEDRLVHRDFNIIFSMFWLLFVLICGSIYAVSFVLNHTLKPVIRKIVNYIQSKNKKEK